MDDAPRADEGRGRRVLVTGAASGLGLALVRRFAARGDRVMATDLASTRQALPGGRDLLPPRVRYLRLDVRQNDHWLAARDFVVEEWGGLDVLVNNAGVSAGRIDKSTIDEWQWITDINLLGVVRGCYVFTPVMKRQHSGHIVNVASIAGLLHQPGLASFNAVKAAVVALSENLQHELEPYDIATSVVCPPFSTAGPAGPTGGARTHPAERTDRPAARSPLGAEDIADAVMAGIDERRQLILVDEPAPQRPGGAS